jgi:hypothetical protein
MPAADRETKEIFDGVKIGMAVLIAPSRTSRPRLRNFGSPAEKEGMETSIRYVIMITLCDDLGECGMKKGALALLVHGGTDNWSPARWKSRFDDVGPDRPVVQLTDAAFDPTEVHYAAVWKPKPGELAAFPNLRVIFNLGAGVDALMADGSLPDVPLVRVAVSDLTERMTEYVVLHVLMHHRQELYLRESQREKRWAPKPQWAAGAISVGILNAAIRPTSPS